MIYDISQEANPHDEILEYRGRSTLNGDSAATVYRFINKGQFTLKANESSNF